MLAVSSLGDNKDNESWGSLMALGASGAVHTSTGLEKFPRQTYLGNDIVCVSLDETLRAGLPLNHYPTYFYYKIGAICGFRLTTRLHNLRTPRRGTPDGAISLGRAIIIRITYCPL
jgi:hypothetical protein